MFTTALFNLLDRYDDNADYNPVAHLVLRHSLAVCKDERSHDELNYLLDFCFNPEFKHSLDSDGTFHVHNSSQHISLTSNNILFMDDTNLPCIIEECCDLVSIVSSGEVVAVFPKRCREELT